MSLAANHYNNVSTNIHSNRASLGQTQNMYIRITILNNGLKANDASIILR